MNVKAGIIENIKIYGDFLGSTGTTSLEKKLEKQKYNLATITNIIENANINEIFGENFLVEEIIKSIIK